MFVRNPKSNVAITNWIFNGWAKYDNWRADNKMPEYIAKRERRGDSPKHARMPAERVGAENLVLL